MNTYEIPTAFVITAENDMEALRTVGELAKMIKRDRPYVQSVEITGTPIFLNFAPRPAEDFAK